VRVKASVEAIKAIQSRGGRLYVHARSARCCHGTLTFLETSPEPGHRLFRRVPAEGLELYVEEGLREPDELELDLGGLRRRQVRAYWNGCAYVV
jgi:hypothetical protein